MNENKYIRLGCWIIALGCFIGIFIQHWKAYHILWEPKDYNLFEIIIDLIFIIGFGILIIFELTIWKNK